MVDPIKFDFTITKKLCNHLYIILILGHVVTFSNLNFS